ncbi:MAG: hypothetical protein ACR2LN_05400 [Candidatus Levyibacteriota bacterium]
MKQTILTKKQQAIVTLIPRFRFLDRTHIQSFMHHKEKQRINKWLKVLTTEGYLRRIYEDTIIGKNRRPALFSLDTHGIRLVNNLGIYDSSFLRKFYFEKERSETFIQHCLLLATICCGLEKKNSEIVQYEYATQSDLSAIENPFRILKQAEVSLDLVFSKKEKRKKIKYFLLTLIDRTLPKYRIRNRIRQFQTYYFSNEWENSADTRFPTLLIVCETKAQMIYTKRYMKQLFQDSLPKDLSFHFSTAQEVMDQGVTGAIWETI